MINEVTIDGIKYVAVDEKINGNLDLDFSCRDCDIYKARVPQNMAQLPLCFEDEYCKVNESCCEQDCNGIKRIWKKKED